MVRVYNKLVHSNGVNGNSCSVIYKNNGSNKLVHSNGVNGNSCSVIYKFTNIFLLLLLTFGSYGVSFGMENVNLDNLNNFGNNYMYLIRMLEEKKQYMPAIVGLMTGIGGYDNKYYHLFWNFYISRRDILKIADLYFPKWLSFIVSLFYMSLNYHIPFKFPITKWDIDLHILGFNYRAPLIFSAICAILIKLLPCFMFPLFILSSCFNENFFQIIDFEIKVSEYWSISLNLGLLYLDYFWLSQKKM